MSTPQNDDAATSPDPSDGASAAGHRRPQPRYGAYAPSHSGDGSGTETGSTSQTEAESAETYNPYAQPTWGQPGGASGGSQQSTPQQSSDPYGAGSYGANPYGSNPYGSDPYGSQQQSHPGAAQSSWQHAPADQGQVQQPGQYPPGGYPAQQRPKRPATLWTVLATLLAAGVTSLIWGLYVLVTLPAQSLEGTFGGAFNDIFFEEMERQAEVDPNLQNLSAQELEEATLAMFGIMALVWSGILLALYITTAFLGAMVGNPGRILATIWAGLSLLFFTLGHDGASYGLISATVALSLVAVIMMWLPASSQYVRHRKWQKETMRGGYYPPYPSQ